MTDAVFVTGLALHAYHGVMQHEAKVGQTFNLYRLVEAAAGAVAQAILDRFPQVLRVRVTVHKPHAPIAATFAGVGVTIVRDRQGQS